MAVIANPSSHDEYVYSHFYEAYQIFHRRVQKNELLCQIHNAYSSPNEINHNCLGCNFNELTDQTEKLLRVCADQDVGFTLQQAFSLYSFQLNSIWESLSNVFDLVSLPSSYRCRHFQPFIRNRRWANFFKHPQSFVYLVHHPLFTFEESEAFSFNSLEPHLIVDDEFVETYYAKAHKERAKGLTKKFEQNKNNVCVKLPNLVQLTNGICDSLEVFVDVVSNNPVYREILDERSTIVELLIEEEEVE